MTAKSPEKHAPNTQGHKRGKHSKAKQASRMSLAELKETLAALQHRNRLTERRLAELAKPPPAAKIAKRKVLADLSEAVAARRLDDEQVLTAKAKRQAASDKRKADRLAKQAEKVAKKAARAKKLAEHEAKRSEKDKRWKAKDAAKVLKAATAAARRDKLAA